MHYQGFLFLSFAFETTRAKRVP